MLCANDSLLKYTIFLSHVCKVSLSKLHTSMHTVSFEDSCQEPTCADAHTSVLHIVPVTVWIFSWLVLWAIGRLWRSLLAKSDFWGLVLYSWKKKATERTAKPGFSIRWEESWWVFKSYYMHSHECPCTSILCPVHSGATFSMKLRVVLQLCWRKLHISNRSLKCWTLFCLLNFPSWTCFLGGVLEQNYVSPCTSCALLVGQEVHGEGCKLCFMVSYNIRTRSIRRTWKVADSNKLKGNLGHNTHGNEFCAKLMHQKFA